MGLCQAPADALRGWRRPAAEARRKSFREGPNGRPPAHVAAARMVAVSPNPASRAAAAAGRRTGATRPRAGAAGPTINGRPYGRRLAVETRTDEQLLQAYVDGDREAFAELIGRYRDQLLHFLTRFLGSMPAAEDVFQETFVQLHLSATMFDPTRRLKPTLTTPGFRRAL